MYVPEVEIKTVADPFMNAETEEFVRKCGVTKVTKDAEEILQDKEIEAVIICSSTDTHSKYIIEAAKAGKHIFCEKPVDYDLKKVHEAIDTAKEANVSFRSDSADDLTIITEGYTMWFVPVRSAMCI